MARGARVVRVETVTPERAAELPSRATEGSACFDLKAAAAVQLRAGRIELVPTGLRMRAPRGSFLEVRPRSGLSARGVLMVNAPGTIDRDYSGEVFVPLTLLWGRSYRIRRGDRIGQIRLVQDHPVEFRRGRVRAVRSRRGGFGSTGR